MDKLPLKKQTNVGLVSACLLGLRCRYDGTHKRSDEVIRLIKSGFTLLPVCPEQLGGLPTPRPKNRIVGGDGKAVLDGKAKVIDEEGTDNTDCFIKGAEETLRIAVLNKVKVAYLKQGSPSCGCSRLGSKRNGTVGYGVTAALLMRNKIALIGVE